VTEGDVLKRIREEVWRLERGREIVVEQKSATEEVPTTS